MAKVYKHSVVIQAPFVTEKIAVKHLRYNPQVIIVLDFKLKELIDRPKPTYKVYLEVYVS